MPLLTQPAKGACRKLGWKSVRQVSVAQGLMFGCWLCRVHCERPIYFHKIKGPWTEAQTRVDLWPSRELCRLAVRHWPVQSMRTVCHESSSHAAGAGAWY